MQDEPKYPAVKVKIVGTNLEALPIIKECRRAMREAELDNIEIETFTDEAVSGNYQNLMKTITDWFDIQYRRW